MSIVDHLWQIEKGTTDLEQGMNLIRGLLMEEERALMDLERTKRLAEEQTAYIEQIAERCKSVKLPGDGKYPPFAGNNHLKLSRS